MKRILAAFVAVLAFTSVAFAATLPNYAKDGQLLAKWACDNGKTAVKEYDHSQWDVLEIRPASGEVFVDVVYSGKDKPDYFMQAAGSKEMKAVSEKEFFEALEKSSLNSVKEYLGIDSDCRMQ